MEKLVRGVKVETEGHIQRMALFTSRTLDQDQAC